VSSHSELEALGALIAQLSVHPAVTETFCSTPIEYLAVCAAEQGLAEAAKR